MFQASVKPSIEIKKKKKKVPEEWHPRLTSGSMCKHTYAFICKRTHNTKESEGLSVKKKKKILYTDFLLSKRFGMVHLPLQIKAFSSVARKQKSTNRY